MTSITEGLPGINVWDDGVALSEAGTAAASTCVPDADVRAVGPSADDCAEPDPLFDKYMRFAGEHQALLDRPTVSDRVREGAKDAAAVASVMLDTPLVYESLWGSAIVAASEAGHNPVAGVAAATALALGTQLSSTWGAARILASEMANRVTTSNTVERLRRSLHQRLGKLGIDATSENVALNAAAAFVAGEPLMLTANQVNNPERTERENRRLGLKVAPITTAMALPLNIAVAEGLTNDALGMETRIGLPALMLLGTVAAQHVTGHVLRGRSRRAQNTEAESQEDNWEPRYHLSKEEFAELQADLVGKVREARQKDKRPDGITAVAMGSRSPYADLVRTLQVSPELWPELEQLMKPYEDNLQFIALVDTRNNADRIVHAFCLSNARLGSEKDRKNHPITSHELPIALLQDLVNSGQINADELRNYYKGQGVKLDDSVSVETNFKVGDKVPSLNGMRTSDYGYLAVFKLASSMNKNPFSKTSIFAHLNKVAKVSLQRSGVKFKPVAGRAELQTPTTDGKTDPHFAPFEIPGSLDNVTRFKIGAWQRRKTLHIIEA